MSAPATILALDASKQLAAVGGRRAKVAVSAGVASTCFNPDPAMMDRNLGALARLVLEGDYPRVQLESGFTLVSLPRARFVVAEGAGEDGAPAFSILGPVEYVLARTSPGAPISFNVFERGSPSGWLQ